MMNQVRLEEPQRRQRLNQRIEERLFSELETVESRLFKLESNIEQRNCQGSPIYKEVLKLFNNELDALYIDFEQVKNSKLLATNSKFLETQSNLKAVKQKLKLFSNIIN